MSKVSAATKQIYNALVCDESARVSSQFLVSFLRNKGLLRSDKRLTGMFEYLQKIEALEKDVPLTVDQFNEATSTCPTLVDKAVTGKLRIPDFKSFTEQIKEVYELVNKNRTGANAAYIPQLAQVNPEQFGISVTTVDGQHFSIGDCDNQFCIQSCSKVISYLVAQKDFGAEYVHNHVGVEPSGRKFNEMCLKEAPSPENPGRQIPHNPCINAGAIMAVSMVFPEEKERKDRLNKVLDVWKRLSGGPDAPIGYDDETYKSESATADRNWCLGYMMKEKDAFPPCFSSLSETLELYFQICSILSTNRAMAHMSATLANGGMNPLTGERVFNPDHVRNVLPIMLSSGMYDYSGKWAYDIGIPAKSGVGGCVFAIVPNVCGISVFSPRLDAVGNSVRGVHASTELVKRFQFHNFEVFSGLSRTKIDPTQRKGANKQAVIGELLFAASEGDYQALFAQHSAGVDLFAQDYDCRTALHLAASEGHDKCVEFLIKMAPEERKDEVLSARDRWGGTPLGDAMQRNHTGCIELLKKAGAAESNVTHSVTENKSDSNIADWAGEILYSAADGDLEHLIALRATNVDLTVCDYDHRTALHLAACNGHTSVVKYLLTHAQGKINLLKAAVDRWGGTPHADAVREGHEECAKLLAH